VSLPTVTPIRDGSFPFDPRLVETVAADRAGAAALMGLEVLPEAVEVPVWAYLLKAPEGLCLVDTGAGSLLGPRMGGLAKRLGEIGVVPGDIALVLLTHLHGDHCGGLLTPDGGAAFPAARVAVPGAELDWWLGGAAPEDSGEIARDAARAIGACEGRLLRVAPGDRIGPAEALAAPGHTPGHMAYALHGARALAAGDIFHLPAVQLARPELSAAWDHDPREAARTRRALLDRARLEGWDLLTGHGGIIGHHRAEAT
jgi:glyoxylase-like metal-dependent hydrolase (beta-lactamase superfamily II)